MPDVAGPHPGDGGPSGGAASTCRTAPRGSLPALAPAGDPDRPGLIPRIAIPSIAIPRIAGAGGRGGPEAAGLAARPAIAIVRWLGARPSTMPSPHSTTVTESSRVADRGRRPRPGRRAGRRRRAPGPGPPRSDGCTRAMTKVGEVIGAADVQAGADALGQRGLARAERPDSTTRSPGRSSRQPRAQVAHLRRGGDTTVSSTAGASGRLAHILLLILWRPARTAIIRLRAGRRAAAAPGSAGGDGLGHLSGRSRISTWPAPGILISFAVPDPLGHRSRPAAGGRAGPAFRSAPAPGSCPARPARAAGRARPGPVELRDHLDRRGPDHPLQEVHHGRAYVRVAEADPSGCQERHVVAG